VLPALHAFTPISSSPTSVAGFAILLFEPFVVSMPIATQRSNCRPHQTLRTKVGLQWEPRSKGGVDPLLRDGEMSLFRSIMDTDAAEVKVIVADLHRKRIQRRADLLDWVGCHGLAVHQLSRLQLEDFPPSHRWAKLNCRRIGFCFMRPLKLEQMEWRDCNMTGFHAFLGRFSAFITLSLELILGTDEIEISSKRVSKALVTD